MTSLDKIEQRRPAMATRGSHLALELIETIRLAVPIALTQLGQIAMMTTDLALIGRLGDEAVAAAALAHTCSSSAFTFGMGLVSAVAPLAAQAFGARDPRMVRRSLARRPVGRAADSLPMILPPLYGEQILLALGQAPAAARLAQQYLLGPDLGHCAGAVVHRHPRLHGRGQPAGAGAVDHAGRDPGQCRCWSTC